MCSTRPQQDETCFASKIMSTITSYSSLGAHGAITLDLPARFPCHNAQSNLGQVEVPESGCYIFGCVLRDHHILVLCIQILELITSYEGTLSPLLDHFQSAPARTIWLPRETSNGEMCSTRRVLRDHMDTLVSRTSSRETPAMSIDKVPVLVVNPHICLHLGSLLSEQMHVT